MMRASFRRLSPLLILALLLGALALFHAAPAQAQETAVWSATLTADQSGVYFGCDNDPGWTTAQAIWPHGGWNSLMGRDLRHRSTNLGSDNDELTFLVFTNGTHRPGDKTPLEFFDAECGEPGFNQRAKQRQTAIVWSSDPDDWTDGARVWLRLRPRRSLAFASA